MNGWVRVTSKKPCPICGKPDNCCVSDDGALVWCGRVSDGAIRENGGGQFLHKGDGEMRPPPPSVKPPIRDFEGFANKLFDRGAAARFRLEQVLGVKESALFKLWVGWTGRSWSFPERDSLGRVIGICYRLQDGSKRQARGGRRGLVYSRPPLEHETILAVEGASDVAACLSIGLYAIGRPSNRGGVYMLGDLLQRHRHHGKVIIIGERDKKPDGRYPGREGAVMSAAQLARYIKRQIHWSMPPEGFKDIREWLNSGDARPLMQLLGRQR
jgi:hypothetical protein